MEVCTDAKAGESFKGVNISRESCPDSLQNSGGSALGSCWPTWATCWRSAWLSRGGRASSPRGSKRRPASCLGPSPVPASGHAPAVSPRAAAHVRGRSLSAVLDGDTHIVGHPILGLLLLFHDDICAMAMVAAQAVVTTAPIAHVTCSAGTGLLLLLSHVTEQ